ncbi:MAG: IclR family transcriptional regulator [Pseudomonadota bacterium]|jgi:DNA-binding IclR family transcriptional regulator
MAKAAVQLVEQKAKKKPPQKDRQFVTALARGLDILRCFSRHNPVLGNAEIAQRSRLPKPTVSRLTHTLTKLGYLDYSPDSGKYSLSAGVLALGYSYLASLDVREIARPLMQELANYAQATVSLGARDQLHMVYLEVCQGSQMFHMRMEVGARVPHGTTAMGRAYLCALPEEERQARIEQYRKITTKEEWENLKASLEKAYRDYQKYGFCLSLGDWNKDVYAVGVPMVSRDGKRILAFNCSGPIFDMTRQKLIQDIGPRLVQLRDKVYAATHGNF